MGKRKREKLLEESLNQIEEKRKVDSLIDRDLEIKAVAADDNKENDKPQKKVKKLSNGNLNGLVNGDHVKIKKKKKDQMKAEEKKVSGKTEDKASKLDEEESQSEVPSSHEINTEGLNCMSDSDPKDKNKKKKKSKKSKKDKNENENNILVETITRLV